MGLGVADAADHTARVGCDHEARFPEVHESAPVVDGGDTREAPMKPKPSKPGRSGRGHCGACHHPRRELIDLGLITGTPKATLAQRFDISVDTLSRHAANHLPPQVRAAIMTQLAPSEIDLEALQRSESESLLAALIAQRARLSTMAQAALEHDLPQVAVRCENAVLANLELVSRLLGQLVHRSEIVSKSFLITADYLKFRTILVEELRGHPEIAARIASRVAAIEQDAAEVIVNEANNPQPLMIEQRDAEAT